MKLAGVVGAGLMGTGIAKHIAAQGMNVILVDQDAGQLQTAAWALADTAVTTTTRLQDIAAADYVIEAVFEDLDTKRAVLAGISQLVSPDCVIATNTSSLLIGDLAEAVRQPKRFLGVHYNNPADFNPIVEVIPAAATGAAVTESMLEWLNAAGKNAVQCADTHCFVLNRQSLPYINEAARCLDVATPGEVDHIAVGKLGASLGPFAVMNLVGLPVMAAASRNLSVLGRGYEPAQALQRQADKGSPWQINPVDGVDRSVISTVVKRLRGAMLFPGKDILYRRLCSPDDLHNICINALGYEKSSVELLNVLKPHIVEELIDVYLRQC